MDSPIFTLFVFQLIIALVDAFGAETVNNLIWSLYNSIPFVPKSKDAHREIALKKEIFKLKTEMNATSAQDDFAKWARIRRQHDKKSEEYKTLTTNMSSSKGAFASRLNTVRLAIVYGYRLYAQWHYSKTPIYWLPFGWLPWYAEWILSFPRAPRGSVSIQVWQLACSAVITVVFDAIKSLYTMYVQSRTRREEEQVKEKAQKMK